jgi:hypothetical protein
MVTDTDASSDVSVWTDASENVRSVVKWIAAAFGALGAGLIGTAPLGGIADINNSVQRIVALAFGALALAAVGYIVWKATALLTPTTLTLRMVAKQREFQALRQQIAADPTAYLGQWGSNVADFIENRDTDYRALANVDRLILTLPSADPFLKTLIAERPSLVERTLACGKVTRRLLAVAGFHDLSRRFSNTKVKLFVAAALVAIGVVGFITTTSLAPAAPAPVSTVTPALVSLTSRGVSEQGSLLGSQCRNPFRAIVLSGGLNGPWELQVTDETCMHGTIIVRPDQASFMRIYQ